MATQLDAILNVVMPIVAVCIVIFFVWKAFGPLLEPMFSWMFEKFGDYAENQRNKPKKLPDFTTNERRRISFE
jgi:hypothetical protein